MRRAAVAVMVSAALFVLVPPSFADTVPMSCPDGTSVVVELGATTEEFAANFAAACAGHQGGTGSDPNGGGNQTEPTSQEPQGHWEWVGYTCDNGGICGSELLCDDGSPQLIFVFIDANGDRGEQQTYCPDDPDVPTPRPPTPDQIARAFKKVKPPKAVLAIQPPGGRTLVNLDTVFSTQAREFSTGPMALIPGYRVEFVVSPRSFTWSFGDETAVTTHWEGRPWSTGANLADLITHTYARSGSVDTAVAVVWGATASINGAAPIPIEATVRTTSSEVALDVLEAKPQLVLR